MIYVASPFFNPAERAIYQDIINNLRDNFPEEEIYIPAEHEIPNAWDMPNHEWGKKVFDMDIQALDRADKVVVINWGMYSDTGTAWECGYAYAKGKYIAMVFAGQQQEASLMMVNGCSYCHKRSFGNREVK